MERSDKEVKEKKRVIEESELYFRKVIDEKCQQIDKLNEENR